MDATNGRPMSRDIGYRIEDVWDDMVRDIEERASTMEALSQRDVKDYRALQRVQVNTLFRDKLYHLYTAVLMESKARCAIRQWGQAMDVTGENATKKNRRNHTPMTDAQIKALISQGVADAFAEHETNRSRNSDDSHDLGGDGRRKMHVARDCTTLDFLKCQHPKF
ncbi:hypothetical protein Tco_0211347 [Tanacetum coccineum]